MIDDEWYDKYLSQYHLDIANQTGMNIKHVEKVYNWLVNDGMIDYDIEKELLWERYTPIEEDYEEE